MCGGGWRLNIYSYGSSSTSASTSTSTSTSTTASATATAGPQIWDIWNTRNDQSQLFQRLSLSNPITFTNPGSIGQADIVVDDSQLYQDMDGFGVSLPDSSASMLQNLKNANSNNYWQLLHTLFDPTDGAATAGLSIVRVPLGASDFSANVYSFHDTYDPNLGSFNINAAPSYLWSTLADIVSVNPSIKIMVAPWSPPGWMKDSGTMLGGTFQSTWASTLANYLLKSVQGFQSMGFTVSHLAIQNEPENSNPTYPTCIVNADDGANVAAQLRQLLNSNGFGNLKIMALEHNWDLADSYPIQELNDQYNAFAGASFHCYSGTVDQQMSFYNAFPNKEVHFTECIGTYGSDWWSDIKWDMSNLMIGSPSYMSRSVVMWAVALDGAGNPKLPGTDSCAAPGCRPIATVNYDGTYSLNQEFYSLAQASRAVVPKDSSGPFGQRIGSSINGNLNYELIVSAYKTGRSAAADTDWNRYSLVVLNWNDQTNAGPVTTTIEFRGLQATYSFPIGVTTLWWFAEN
ncbi:glycoside hydrolase family 30 protein [Calocera viscosa TUFC12733]|uniref:Glycoside hydrolase family 30 protein n=1 Tax=Calocera viscosa (strain TUFC12733) TaxID=1330018 RepID=A0A167MM04_CALVF|nr:glycoside hydrolase family 30 protein [Calocera viscosa TUFC12733]